MSKYTTEVRYICEHYAGYDKSQPYADTNYIISESRKSIFDFNYPLFDEEYKPVLETKILKHYYGREIGAETVGRWKLWLDMRMNEIMPYYNKLYDLYSREFNPLYDTDYYRKIDRINDKIGNEESKQGGGTTESIDIADTLNKGGTITEEHEGDITDEKTGSIRNKHTGTITDNRDISVTDSGSDVHTTVKTNINDRWEMFQDTPQGSLDNVRNETYLTNVKHTTDDTTGSQDTLTITYGKVESTNDDNTRTLNNQDEEFFGTTDKRTLGNTDTTTLNTEDGRIVHNDTVRNIDTNQKRDTTLNTTEDYLEHVYGKMNSGLTYIKAISEYRKNLLNIDMLIIKDLSDLFMQLW